MDKTVYIVDIEGIPTRYTCQWKTTVPDLFRSKGADVVVIDGGEITSSVTTGAFLNFAATNLYKANQVAKLAHLFDTKQVKDGDYFLFTDAWHPGVINLRYMLDLLGINAVIGGLWHAGAYDPNDFLGRMNSTRQWAEPTELAYFSAYDHNFFATNDHIQMFWENRLSESMFGHSLAALKRERRIIRTGWPMEYMRDVLLPKTDEKENLILFPHRKSVEKQPEIFKDLAASMPDFEFVFCQDVTTNKTEYHELLSRAKIIFSANLQETLGISTCAEGPLAGCIPIAPDRLSYTEIFESYPTFLYPSKWTESFNNYLTFKPEIIKLIRNTVKNYDSLREKLEVYVTNEYEDFFHGDVLVDTIMKD